MLKDQYSHLRASPGSIWLNSTQNTKHKIQNTKHKTQNRDIDAYELSYAQLGHKKKKKAVVIDYKQDWNNLFKSKLQQDWKVKMLSV